MLGGIELKVRYQVDGLAMTKELIAKRIGMTVVGFNSIARELRDGSRS